MGHVTSAARAAFAAIIGDALFSLAKEPTWEALYTLCCAPKLVLRAVTASGAQSTGLLSHEIGRRIRLFQNGQFQQLWGEADCGGDKGHRPRTRRFAQEEEEDTTGPLQESL